MGDVFKVWSLILLVPKSILRFLYSYKPVCKVELSTLNDIRTSSRFKVTKIDSLIGCPYLVTQPFNPLDGVI